MRYATSYSKAPDTAAAIAAIGEELATGLGGHHPDLSFCFVSHEHADHFDRLAAMLYEKTKTRFLLGCTGEMIVGGGEEIETGPAISVWAAALPVAEIDLFHAEFFQTPDGLMCNGLPTGLENHAAEVRAIFALGEPYSAVPNSLIEYFAEELPGVPIIGGMASGGAGPNTNRLFLNSTTLSDGFVGAIVRGGPAIRSVVSQGCRPVGKPYVVTLAEQNLVLGLGGIPPLQRLRELLPTLPEGDQQSLRRGPHLGIAMNEYQETFARGDFLIANVMGLREEDGSLAIGAIVRVGQTVQFHVRDAATADEDLIGLLEQDRSADAAPPKAGLLFTCNGRGTRLFTEPHHDAATIQQRIGPLPLAGFFAQGELGPVGNTNYIHGFTASIALFE